MRVELTILELQSRALATWLRCHLQRFIRVTQKLFAITNAITLFSSLSVVFYKTKVRFELTASLQRSSNWAIWFLLPELHLLWATFVHTLLIQWRNPFVFRKAVPFYKHPQCCFLPALVGMIGLEPMTHGPSSTKKNCSWYPNWKILDTVSLLYQLSYIPIESFLFSRNHLNKKLHTARISLSWAVNLTINSILLVSPSRHSFYTICVVVSSCWSTLSTGGGGGIRTHAPVTWPTGFQDRTLQPTWVLLHIQHTGLRF